MVGQKIQTVRLEKIGETRGHKDVFLPGLPGGNGWVKMHEGTFSVSLVARLFMKVKRPQSAPAGHHRLGVARHRHETISRWKNALPNLLGIVLHAFFHIVFHAFHVVLHATHRCGLIQRQNGH